MQMQKHSKTLLPRAAVRILGQLQEETEEKEEQGRARHLKKMLHYMQLGSILEHKVINDLAVFN